MEFYGIVFTGFSSYSTSWTRVSTCIPKLTGIRSEDGVLSSKTQYIHGPCTGPRVVEISEQRKA